MIIILSVFVSRSNRNRLSIDSQEFSAYAKRKSDTVQDIIYDNDYDLILITLKEVLNLFIIIYPDRSELNDRIYETELYLKRESNINENCQ